MDDPQLVKLKRWFQAACDNEKSWRYKAKMWHDYFHGDQLDSKTLKQMQARKQPPIKFNLIKSIINLLTGQEIQGRTDIQFLGFEESDDIKAETLTEIYRQQNHADNFQYEMTYAFQDGAIGGRGQTYVDWDSDESEIVREYVDWKEVYCDPASKRPDYSDSRHMFRVKWVDEDVALDMFPSKEEILQICKSAEEDEEIDGQPTKHKEDYYDEFTDDGDIRYYDGNRKRVKLVECFWLEGKTVKTAMYCYGGFLIEPKDFGRKHNKFPFVFTYCERDSNGEPYGLVKDLLDPQDVINKMLSKSMHILGTKQVLAEKGALKNTANVQNQIAKPDSVINDFEDGSLSSGKVIINDNRTDAGLAFNQFEVAVNAMHRISGVNPELQGLHTNARSGTAISMRLRQGNTVLTKLYDCLEKTKKGVAQLYIYLMAQYVKTEKIARYKLPNGQLEEVKLNSSEEVMDNTTGKMLKVKSNELKDIFKYDIVIVDSAKAGNANEAEFTQLVELIKAVPQVVTPGTLSELVKATHLPNKEEIARSFTPPQPSGDGTPTSGVMQ